MEQQSVLVPAWTCRLLSTLPKGDVLRVDEVQKADFELLKDGHEVHAGIACT